MFRKILKVIFWMLIIALLVLPLGLISQISSAEMEEYAPADSPVIRQSAIGTPVKATRQDVELHVNVTGSFTCTEVAFMELTQRKPYNIRWIVSYGDETQIGQVLGYYNGDPVISTVEGILRDISTSTGNAYLSVDCFSPLVLECMVEDRTLDSLLQCRENLTLTDGSKVELVYIARAKNADGTTMVRFSLAREGDAYGSAVKDLPIYLGAGYPQVVVLPMDCVYQKTEGEDEPWFVRHVTEEGILIEEFQVKVSYSDGNLAVVSGIQEGQWFDSGYKVVVQGDDQ